MHVEGEEPISPDWKGLESGAREPSLLRARCVYGYVLSGGAQWLRPTLSTRKALGLRMIRSAPKSSSF
jgi:hypothetical protein